MSLEFKKSSRGKDILLLDNNIFYNEYKVDNTGGKYWKCKFHKSKRCPSRTVTKGATIVKCTAHNHAVDSMTIEKKNIATSMNDDKNGCTTEERKFVRHKDSLNQIVKADNQEIEQGSIVTVLPSQSYIVDQNEKHREAIMNKYNLLKQGKCNTKSAPEETSEPITKPLETSMTLKSDRGYGSSEFFTKINEAHETEANHDDISNNEDSPETDHDNSSSDSELCRKRKIIFNRGIASCKPQRHITAYEMLDWNDPNLLCDRLRMILSELGRGNYENSGEINFIINELRQAGYIY